MRGRGNLVVDFCNGNMTADEYFKSLPLAEYNPFNLLMVDFKSGTVSVGSGVEKSFSEISSKSRVFTFLTL